MIRAVSRALAVVAAATVIGLVTLTGLDVGSRLLTGRSLPGMIEYAEVLMVALVYLGMAEAQRTKVHVSVTLLLIRLTNRQAAMLRLLGSVIVLALISFITYATLGNAVRSFEAGEFRFGITATPVWPARFLIPIGLAALMGELVCDVIDYIAVLRGRTPQPVVESRPLAGPVL
jgi:TRAP-type mannitol/chloroaromatic compound transport system permease small subunit